ncbi:MAG: DNA lyase [Deltaproteobacteria bacterium]|nr:DNA lyase [Deltaproteobacteria bacterium]
MRIWTVHPRYLDRQGLIAVWREALLAQAVLTGMTKGYRKHPQLERFRTQKKPFEAISEYLSVVYDEACRRGYCFDRLKIKKERADVKIIETDGQLLYEWQHLKNKLEKRSPDLFREYENIEMPAAHPLFEVVPGEIQKWEKLKA